MITLNVAGTYVCFFVTVCVLTRLDRTLNTGPDYPQNFIIVNESGILLAGVDAELNHALPSIARPPVAVDTISRYVYWYHESLRAIARQSLNSASMDVQV